MPTPVAAKVVTGPQACSETQHQKGNARHLLQARVYTFLNWNYTVGWLRLLIKVYDTGAVFSYKLRYIVGFWLVEMAISTNQKPTIYRNLYENTGPEL